MLMTLCSNRNIERILLFLFVNEKGYGSQIKSLLNIPLTPIQNALNRLEEGSVIQGVFYGNKKIYSFDSNYPLRKELESLLKKAYMLLPTEEKKSYCYIHKPRSSFKEEVLKKELRRKELQRFWQRLLKVKNSL